MSHNYQQLTYFDVGLTVLVGLIPLLLSLRFGLRLEKQMAMAVFRMVVQLWLVGMVLHWVFALQSVWIILGCLLAMTLIAGLTVPTRVSKRYPKISLDALVSIFAASWSAGAFAVLMVVKPSPWYAPQYLIPLVGMILGNMLNGFTLGIERFLSDCHLRRDEIEASLALGATRWEAGSTIVSDAIRTALIPIINAMMISGLVSLPGMLTGQILGGVSPLEAVKYQVMIMILIFVSTALGSMLVILLAFHRLFSPSLRLNHALLSQKS